MYSNDGMVMTIPGGIWNQSGMESGKRVGSQPKCILLDTTDYRNGRCENKIILIHSNTIYFI